MMLNSSQPAPEKDSSQKRKDKPKRTETNLLFRLTKSIVETLKICNPKFKFLNPKDNLTEPSEGVYNNGWDNIECDYILRAGDFIITPEGKE